MKLSLTCWTLMLFGQGRVTTTGLGLQSSMPMIASVTCSLLQLSNISIAASVMTRRPSIISVCVGFVAIMVRSCSLCECQMVTEEGGGNHNAPCSQHYPDGHLTSSQPCIAPGPIQAKLFNKQGGGCTCLLE